MFKKAMLLIE